MNNLNGNRKNEFRRKQEEKQRKLALKIEDEAGELREGSLKSEEAIPSLDELCAMGERVEQQTTFSAKEAIRNKIKARRDAERYKTTSTDSEKWTPNPFEDSNAAAIESPKNEDTLNTTRKHADAQSTKSAGLKTSKRRSIVEMVQKLKKYVPIVVCGDVLYYYNGYYYEAIGLEKLIKLYRKYVDYDLNNEPSLYAYKDLYQCCTTDPELERSEPENQSIHAPLENGVYDLMKKELKPHDPRRLIFTYIKASYDESAECPVFNSFLKQITHGNPQLEERFWMAIGYLMIYPARGKFFIVMGYARDSGKSVLGNFIQRLYPKESVGNLRLQEMKGTFSSMSFLNAVINLELDMPNAKLNAEVASRLKQITGGDSITVQFKFKKIALILLSSIVMIAGIQLGETNLSPEVLAKRKAESEAAAASQAALEAQEAAESASRAAEEEAASKAAQEKAESEAAVATENEIASMKAMILKDCNLSDIPRDDKNQMANADEYTFSKQGAYKLTYVDTGKTTELVDDQGFRWEASVYFVVDEDTYNENLQKMFRAEQALYDTYERILNNFGLAE